MRNDLIHRELAECLASGELVEYRPWGDQADALEVGRVVGMTDSRVTFSTVNPDGIPSGEDVRLIRHLHTIERHSRYVERLRRLGEVAVADELPTHQARTRNSVRMLLEDSVGHVVQIVTGAREKGTFRIEAFDGEIAVLTTIFDHKPDGRTLTRIGRIRSVRQGPKERVLDRLLAADQARK